MCDHGIMRNFDHGRRSRWFRGLAVALGFSLLTQTARSAEPTPIWHEPGVDYYQDVNPRQPLVVHVVRIDRSQKDLEFHTTLGGGNQIGTSVLSEQVKFIRPELGKPVAAINGDYFYMARPFAGDPMNLQVLRGGELVSAPGEDRAFFYLDAQGLPHITNAVDNFHVTWPNGKTVTFGLNETPATVGQAVLYTAAAGPNTRLEGVELVLGRNNEEPWLPLRVGHSLTGKVLRINQKGFSPLTADTMVLSLDPKTVSRFPPLTVGMLLKVATTTVPDLSGASLAIGGGPTLVRDGKRHEVHSFTGFQFRHPRSAMGWNDKYFYFVQADGRQPRYSMGMSLIELSDYFLSLKCDQAINLDGGGSCTTWISGKIVNSPSQRGMERPSANALVLVRKPK